MTAASVGRTLLHLAPHPDDELIGAPAALMALRDSGWRIVNLACGLGSPQNALRRESELREACHRARFELQIAEVARSGQGGIEEGRPEEGRPEEGPAEEALADEVVAAVDSYRPEILVAPSPQDHHPAHELVGRAAVRACERAAQGPAVLWLWGLWADLPFPTIAVGFGEERMREVLRCLDAHAGELERNDYRSLVRGRAQMNSSLGPERVFGFGSRAPAGERARYVELLCELSLAKGEWSLGAPRWLDAADPLCTRSAPSGDVGGSGSANRRAKRPMVDWLHGTSSSSLYGGTRTYADDMAQKSRPSAEPKKPGRSLKEKRQAKHAKQDARRQERKSQGK